MTLDERGTGSSRRWLPALLWIALTVALIIVVPALPWREALDRLRHAGYGWVAAAALCNLLILPLWASEWRLLVPGESRVTFARMFEVVAITAAVLNTVPFFAGEVSAVALLIGRAALSRGAALSVLAMDQLLVGAAKLFVLGAAALYAPLPAWLRAGVLSLLVAVGLLLLMLVPLAHGWERIQRRLEEHPSSVRSFAARVAGWGRHLDALRDPARLWRAVLLSLAKKSAELAAIVAVQLAFGLEPSLGAALAVLAALAVTTLVPLAPANLGVYEGTVFGVYRYLGIGDATALGLALVQHLVFLLPALLTGYAILTLRQVPRALRAQ